MTPWFATLPFLHFLDFATGDPWHLIRFEKDTRYYSILLEKDLLDDWVLVVTNGRIQSRLGQVRTIAHTSFADAFNHFCDMIDVRIKRGYRLKIYCGNDVLLQLLPFVIVKQ